jgi:hypothetical protein
MTVWRFINDAPQRVLENYANECPSKTPKMKKKMIRGTIINSGNHFNGIKKMINFRARGKDGEQGKLCQET